MIKLIIFDFDGLIVNSENLVFEALHDLFSTYNHNFTWEYFREHIGMPI